MQISFNKLNKNIKILTINIIILFSLIVIIELIFGGWIDPKKQLENQLAIPISVEWKYSNHLYPGSDTIITYRRDKFGLRGSSIFNKPENIEILTLGGSTTDQRYINEGFTWQDIIEKNTTIKVGNAGIDGQSTIGHLYSLKNWLSKIPNLKPKLIIFYIGINDHYLSNLSFFDDLTNPNKKHRGIREKIEINSFIFNGFRRISGNKRTEIVSAGHQKDTNIINYKFKPTINTHNLDYNQIKYYDYYYKNRIDSLIKISKTYFPKTKILLVSQPMAEYYIDQESKIWSTEDSGNSALIRRYGDSIMANFHNPKNEIYYFDLCAKLNSHQPHFYYDHVHMTKSGAEWVGLMISNYITNMSL